MYERESARGDCGWKEWNRGNGFLPLEDEIRGDRDDDNNTKRYALCGGGNKWNRDEQRERQDRERKNHSSIQPNEKGWNVEGKGNMISNLPLIAILSSFSLCPTVDIIVNIAEQSFIPFIEVNEHSVDM